MEKNSESLWDKFWANESTPDEDKFYLKKEECGIRWQRIEEFVEKKFGSFRGLKVIEIGSGTGTISGLMQRRGADVTLIDYSTRALERAELFFSRTGMEVKCVQVDALNLPNELFNQYDISISLGLAEHFKKGNRLAINKAHFDVLKTGGVTFISVPNKYNPPYRIFKFLAEISGKWSVGEEYPYSRYEFSQMMQNFKVDKYSFFGDSFWGSFFFINPLRNIRKLLKIKPDFKNVKIKRESGSRLDQYLSYALVLCAEKSTN